MDRWSSFWARFATGVVLTIAGRLVMRNGYKKQADSRDPELRDAWENRRFAVERLSTAGTRYVIGGAQLVVVGVVMTLGSLILLFDDE